jgi:hypothetical protein
MRTSRRQGVRTWATRIGVVMTAGGATVMLAAGTASAHTAGITGSATCGSDGNYVVTWSVANDLGMGATITQVVATPTLVTGLVGVLPGRTSEGLVVVTGSSTVPGTAKLATIDVSAVWADGFRSGFQKQLPLAGDCAAAASPTPSPTPTPSPSPAVSPSPTPAATVLVVPSSSAAAVEPSVEALSVTRPAAPRKALAYTGAPVGAIVGWAAGLVGVGALASYAAARGRRDRA